MIDIFKNKFFLLIILIIFIFGALSATAAFYFFKKNYESNVLTGDYPIIIEIPYGFGLAEIAEQIYSLGLIRSKIVFKIYAILSGAADKLQSGTYEIKAPASVPELIEIFKNGPVEISVVIFPGMTLKEIEDRLFEMKIIKAKNLIYYNDFGKLKDQYPFLEGAKNLEGFLLPDTYKFYLNSRVDFVVAKILENFRKQVVNGSKNLIFSGKDANLIKILTIASFLEKEIPDYEEKRIAAGIIEKRLKIGMPLQIDAILIYDKCSGRFLNCPELDKSDFKVDSFYNTYYYRGLTPTPIGNPSIEAVKSVIEKKNSGYLYYLSDPKTKKTIFSVDLDEHNKNRAKYLFR